MTTLHRSDFISLWPFYRTWPFTVLWEVSIETLRRVWHTDMDANSSGHLFMSILGLAFVLLVETSDILYRLYIIPVCDIITVHFYWILLVSIEHLQRVWHADRDAYSFGHLVPSYLGLAYVLHVETNSFPELFVIFPDYAIRSSLGTFSILLISILIITKLWIICWKQKTAWPIFLWTCTLHSVQGLITSKGAKRLIFNISQ